MWGHFALGAPNRRKFPVNSLLTGNSERETSSLLTVSSSGESANFRSLSRWRASNAPAPLLSAGVKIIALHRRDASDVQQAIDHGSSRYRLSKERCSHPGDPRQ